MKFNFKSFKINLSFIVISLVVSLIVIPIVFNIFFLWDSGLSKGKTSDWFTLYGNILGGLIGGFFTYIALLLTFERDKKQKAEETRPRIDIPHKSFEFEDNDSFTPIAIDINNTGGSLAKNIECNLSLPNYEEVIQALELNQTELNIELEKTSISTDVDMKNREKYALLSPIDDSGNVKSSLGGVTKKYNKDFIGSCIPLILDYEAKSQYILENSVSKWTHYIMRNKDYTRGSTKELFELILDVKYSSDEYGSFKDGFKLKWELKGIMSYGSVLKYNYVLSCIVRKYQLKKSKYVEKGVCPPLL